MTSAERPDGAGSATDGWAPGATSGATPRFALFAAPAIPMAAMNLPLAVFLPQYYATRTAIGVAAIGFAFMVVRLADIVFDPLLGIAIDRTATRIGRFRPWMAVGIPVVMLGAWLAFFPPASASLSYLITALVLVFTGYSLVTVTQFSWAAVLARNPIERARAYGWIQFAAVFGMLLILAMLPLLARYLPGSRDLSVHAMGAFVLVMTPLTVLLALTRTQEPQRAQVQERPPVLKALAEYKVLLGRTTVLSVLACTTFLSLASGVTGAIYLFFAISKAFTPEQASLLLLIHFAGAFASSRLWSSVSGRYGKPQVLVGLCVYTFSIQLCAFFLPPGSMVWAGLGQLALGVSYSGTLVLQRAIVGDIAEAVQAERGEDFTGRLYALYTSITKMSVAIAVGVTFYVLQWIGYAPKAGNANAPAVIHHLQLAFILVPASLSAAAALSMLGDRGRHARALIRTQRASVP